MLFGEQVQIAPSVDGHGRNRHPARVAWHLSLNVRQLVAGE